MRKKIEKCNPCWHKMVASYRSVEPWEKIHKKCYLRFMTTESFPKDKIVHVCCKCGGMK